MTQVTSSSSPMIRYLLGKLGESENTAIEETYFSDQDAFEELLIAENEVTDAYVTGRLSSDDRALFESRLLLSPRQHQRARFAKALMSYSAKHANDRSDLNELAPSSLFERLRGIFTLRIAVMSLSTAVLLFVAVTGIWISRPNKTLEKAGVNTDNEPDASVNLITNVSPGSNGQNGSKLAKTSSSSTANPRQNRTRSVPVVATLLLPLTSTRDLSSGSSFTIPRNTTTVKLVAEVEGEGRASYFARLETVDGQQVWHGNAVTSRTGSIVVIVPSEKLKPGDFILTLKKPEPNQTYREAGQFAFSIKAH